MKLLKENKKIFISAGVIFIVLFVVIVLLSLFNKNSNNLVLKCAKSASAGIRHTITIYDYSTYRDVELDTFFSLEQKEREYYKEHSSLLQKELQLKNASIYGEDYTDVRLYLKNEPNGIHVIQNVTVNSENSARMYEILSYDFLYTSVDELRTNLEAGGFLCK